MNKKIGVIVPFDFEVDREYWEYMPAGASIHITRTEFRGGPVTVELVRSISDHDDIRRSVGSLNAIGPCVVAFACTSGSFVNGVAGEEKARTVMMEAGAPKAVTTSGAIVEALAALGRRRIVIATPYIQAIGQLLVAFLEANGLAVLANTHMAASAGADISRMQPNEIENLALRAMHPEAEALVISCTALATYSVIPTLEHRLGIPVITANQATMWSVLRAADVKPPVIPQRLFVDCQGKGLPL